MLFSTGQEAGIDPYAHPSQPHHITNGFSCQKEMCPHILYSITEFKLTAHSERPALLHSGTRNSDSRLWLFEASSKCGSRTKPADSHKLHAPVKLALFRGADALGSASAVFLYLAPSWRTKISLTSATHSCTIYTRISIVRKMFLV